MTDRPRSVATVVALSLVLTLLIACSGSAGDGAGDGAGDRGVPASDPADERTASAATDRAAAALSYKVRRYVRGADQAVGLTFDTRGRLLYAEKDTGRIVRYARGEKTTLARLRVYGGGEAGLLGLTVDGGGNVYAYYTGGAANCPDPTRNAGSGSLAAHCVWRFKPTSSGRLRADGRVFSADHPSSAENHVGGGLHIGPDGALYLSIGDLGENDDPDKGPGRAQSLSVPFGKLLRLDPDGSDKPADGNPENCGDADNGSQRKISDRRIWACGLRNTYQFAFDTRGRIWGAEAGDGCDEINRVAAGVNYGWQPPRTDCAGSGAGRPVLKVSGTPSGIAVPTSKAAGSWRNDVFFCLFSGAELKRYDQATKRLRDVRRAAGKCSYDLAARGDSLFMSSGADIYRLKIRK